MAATPTVASITFFNPMTKQKLVRSATISDVNAAHWVWEDGGNTLNVPAGFTYIIDILTASAMVDCKTSTIKVNNVTIPRVIVNNTLLGTIVNRPFMQAPLKIPSGAFLDLVQNT